jgi:hypothetical protein
MEFPEPPMKTLRPARALAAQAVATILAATLAPASHATDIVAVATPADLVDQVAQVGARRLHLPPGHWVLIARDEVETTGKRGRTGLGLEAWIAREDAGELRALLHVSLPEQDFPRVHHQGNNRCPEEDGIQRADLSTSPELPECLGIYGHRSMKDALASRSLAVLAWMRQHGVADPGSMVRFTYRQRSDGSYGGVSLFLPTAHFESDAVAAAWARDLRAACAPMFEGRARDAALPALPALAPEAGAAVPAAAD